MESDPVGWPFVARERELASVLEQFETGRRLIALFGGAGIGKSRLASHVIAELGGKGYATAVVTASAAAREVPYGALAHLLPVSMPRDVVNPLRWAVEQLTRAGRRHALLIDDAHLLDPASATVVNYVVVHRRAAVLMTLRQEKDAPDAISQLLQNEFAVRITVEPMSDIGIGVVLERILGAPINNPSVRRLAMLAQGNPLLLRELIETAREAGVLQGPPWRLVGPIPLKASGLTEVIAGRLQSLSPAMSEVIDYLALAEPLSLSTLAELCQEAAIEECDHRALIRVSSAGTDGQVRLNHPLYAEVVRSAHRPLTVRRRYRMLVQVLERSEYADCDRLRLAIWRLEAGITQDAEGLVAAARIAWSGHDYRAACRLAEAAVQVDRSPEGSILLATILNFSGRYDSAAEVLAAVPEDAEFPPRIRKDLAQTRAQILIARGNLSEMLTFLEDEQRQLTNPEFRQDLELLRINANLMLGDFGRARDLASAVLDAPAASPAIRAQVLNHLTVCNAMDGRFTDAMETARKALADIKNWRDAVPVVAIPLLMNGFMSALSAGDLAGAQKLLTHLAKETEERSDFAFADSALQWAQAQLLLVRGRLADAAAVVESVTTGMMAAGIQADRAASLALMGDVDGAQRTLELARQLVAEGPPSPLIEFTVKMAEISVEVARGGITQAVTLAVKCAEEARAKHAVPFAIKALHAALNVGAADQVVEQLVDLAEHVQGDLIQLAARQAVAAAERSGPRLLEIANKFAELGYLVLAAEAAADAAGILARSTGPRSSKTRQAAARAAVLVQQCQDLRLPLAMSVTTVQLTPRARQIVTLAAAGRTSQQIAGELVLSVRTVDNHLQHAYAKLGVTSRQELALLL